MTLFKKLILAIIFSALMLPTLMMATTLRNQSQVTIQYKYGYMSKKASLAPGDTAELHDIISKNEEIGKIEFYVNDNGSLLVTSSPCRSEESTNTLLVRDGVDQININGVDPNTNDISISCK